MATTKLGTLFVRIAADVKSFEADLGKAEKSFSKFGKGMNKIGREMTASFTLPIAAAGIGAIKMANDFNKAMAFISTNIPGATERVQQLKGEIQNMAMETGKSTGDLARGMYEIISSFGDTADTMELMRINSKAATAGMSTLLEAVALTSSVTRGYGDTSAAAVQKAADLAFQTVKLGQTTFPELAASMGRTVPMAAAVGVSQEELFAGFASLTGVTGDAAEVSTQLSGILRAMIKPTDSMKAAVAALGMETAKEVIETYGFVGGMQKLMGTTDGTQEAIGELFGRANALTAAFALGGPVSDDYVAKLQAMGAAAGITDEAHKQMTEGINKTGHTWDQIKQKLAVTMQLLGDGLIPIVADLFEALQPLINILMMTVQWFGNLDPKVKLFIVAILGITAAIGPALMMLGQMAIGLSALLAIVGPVVGAIAGPLLGALGALLGPIGLVIAAVVGLIAVWWKWHDEIKEAVGTAKDWIIEKFEIVREKVLGIFNKIKEGWDKVAGFFTKIRDKVEEGLGVHDEMEAARAKLMEIADAAGDKVGGAFTKATGAAKEFVEDAGDRLKRIAGDVTKWGQEMKDKITAPFKVATTEALPAFNEAFKAGEAVVIEYEDTIGDATGNIEDDFKSMNEVVGDTIGEIGVWDGKFEKVLTKWEQRWEETKEVVASWKDEFTDTLAEAFMTGRWEFTNFVNYAIYELIRLATELLVLKPIFDSIANWWNGMFGGMDTSKIGTTPLSASGAHTPELEGAYGQPLYSGIAPTAMQSAAAPPGGAAAGAGNTTVIIEDHRPAGSPAIQKSMSRKGQNTIIRVLVKGAIGELAGTGELDKILSLPYGITRRPA